MPKKKKTPIDEAARLEQIKRLVIIAMFSDDELMDRLVLKGGNALDLIHQLSSRASVDVDFSISDEFPKEELAEVRERIERALRDTFRPVGLESFDVRMKEKPKGLTADMADFWGGYEIEFKLVENEVFAEFSGKIDELRKRALDLGAGARFLIDISKYEYVTEKEEYQFEGFRIFVYTPAMIVCEKLRAICQQMPEYAPIVRRKGRPGSPRARDFLDIYTVITEAHLTITTPENRELLAHIFAAKKVPLPFLGKIDRHRDFHASDFPAVVETVKAGIELEEFDFYFDYVLGLVNELKAMWDV